MTSLSNAIEMLSESKKGQKQWTESRSTQVINTDVEMKLEAGTKNFVLLFATQQQRRSVHHLHSPLPLPHSLLITSVPELCEAVR